LISLSQEPAAQSPISSSDFFNKITTASPRLLASDCQQQQGAPFRSILAQAQQHDDNEHKPGDLDPATTTPPPCSSCQSATAAARDDAQDAGHKHIVTTCKLKPSCCLPRLQPVRRNAPTMPVSLANVLTSQTDAATSQ